jgi:outer membrane protein TolC
MEVSTAHNTVLTAIQSVDLEERNRLLADDQLRLAREQYRLGAGSFIELREAEAVKARADRAWLDAIYQYHQGLATLEAAVGRPLRTTLEGR